MFRTTVTPDTDPPHIVIGLAEALVSGFSGVSAIRAVRKRYQQLHKTVVIRGLDAHWRGHMYRNSKLRPLTVKETLVDVSAQQQEEEQAQRRQHHRREQADVERGEAMEEEEEEEQPRDLEHLGIFRPQGDGLHHPEQELSSCQPKAALLAAGIVIEDDDDDSGDTDAAGGSGRDAGGADDDDDGLRQWRKPLMHQLSHASVSSQASVV